MAQTFRGTLTAADSKRHIVHRFDVPVGATRLSIALEHDPRRSAGAEHDNQVSLSLFDPNGFRGARHNYPDQTVSLSAAHATPGYLPGPIVPGSWTVVLDTHRILPPDALEYRITVRTDTDPSDNQASPELQPGTTVPRGPGWYRGDLHSHTWHSDGVWDVPDLVRFARTHRLDFLALTDHNTVSGLAQLDALGDDDLLTIGGMEATTYYGHALLLGTRRWHDWRVVNGHTTADLARSALEQGILFVIAHPLSPGDPVCTGCRWEVSELMPGIAPAVEIWNGIWQPYNEAGLQLYYRWLNQGHRLVATAGTDNHGRQPLEVTGAALNVVYATELSEPAILNAVRQGRLYLSGGPDLRLTATDERGSEVMMGGTIGASAALRVGAAWYNTLATDRVRLIVDGSLYEELAATEAGERVWNLAGGATHWFLAELRDTAGDMRAITNPIFVDRGDRRGRSLGNGRTAQ